jgi:aminopeptidase N
MGSTDDLICCRGSGAGNGFAPPETEKQYPPDLDLEPVHIDIALDVDIAAETASGTVTTTVAARRTGVRVLKLDAVDFEDLAVRDPDGRELEWRYDGRLITVRWAEPCAAAERRRVAVSYRVTRPVSGLYFSKPTEGYPDQPWFAATDHETERARHWLPCVDQPTVRTTLEFHLTSEARFTILANGRLGETDYGEGSITVHWKLEQRCPSYLICFVIGDLVQVDDGDLAGIPVAYFGTRRFSAEDLKRTFGRTRQMLAWMTRKLDMSYPFPKYYQFALPDFGGAMENISLVSWDDRAVLDETLALEWTRRIDTVNVHEMAHSYFGDAVVCRDFAHAWLKESWATYMEQCWLEDARGRDEAMYELCDNAAAYFKEADDKYVRPIVTREFKSSWQMYDRHLYPGGACRLHMLRCELGDEVFWKGVQDYLMRYSGTVVETDDFRKVLEEHSGRSLGRFFDQWFHAPGYPSVKVSFTYDEEHKQGRFEIEQTQVDKDKGVGLFRLATEVGWTLDGAHHSQPVTLEHAKHTVVVDMPAAPEQVRFDPGAKILHKLEFNPGDPMLRRQLREAPDVIGRILAARELVKTGKVGNLRAVAGTYEAEAFWGVRREIAAALGEAGTEPALGTLLELVELERDPMVTDAVLRALGKYRDPRIGPAVESRVAAGLPYRAAQAAYEALGAQREDAPWDLLLEAARREEFSGFAQSGALRGLAATRRADALEELVVRVRYGATAARARPAAVAALADIGAVQEPAGRERAREALVDLLRDPVAPLRKAAAEGLKTLRAAEALGALEGYSRGLAWQDRVEVERIIDELRSAQQPREAAAQKQLEELQEKYRKLEQRLQGIEDRLGEA